MRIMSFWMREVERIIFHDKRVVVRVVVFFPTWRSAWKGFQYNWPVVVRVVVRVLKNNNLFILFSQQLPEQPPGRLLWGLLYPARTAGSGTITRTTTRPFAVGVFVSDPPGQIR